MKLSLRLTPTTFKRIIGIKVSGLRAKSSFDDIRGDNDTVRAVMLAFMAEINVDTPLLSWERDDSSFIWSVLDGIKHTVLAYSYDLYQAPYEHRQVIEGPSGANFEAITGLASGLFAILADTPNVRRLQTCLACSNSILSHRGWTALARVTDYRRKSYRWSVVRRLAAVAVAHAYEDDEFDLLRTIYNWLCNMILTIFAAGTGWNPYRISTPYDTLDVDLGGGV